MGRVRPAGISMEEIYDQLGPSITIPQHFLLSISICTNKQYSRREIIFPQPLEHKCTKGIDFGPFITVNSICDHDIWCSYLLSCINCLHSLA